MTTMNNVLSDVFSDVFSDDFIDDLLLDNDLMVLCDDILPPTLKTPKYIGKLLSRGQRGFDKFFDTPVSEQVHDNVKVLNTLNFGNDHDVLALPNLCCSAPTSVVKCEVAAESLLFTKATFLLTTEYGIHSLADIYRHLGMLSDRRCISCPVDKVNINIGCVMGTFRCVNCTKKHGRKKDFAKDFAKDFRMWLQLGSPARHGVPAENIVIV